MADSSRIQTLATEYASVKMERAEIEKQVKALKEKESELQREILLELSSLGTTSIKLEGIGRIVRRESAHYAISDINALAFEMFKRFVDNMEHHRPVADGMPLQQRVSSRNLEDYISAERMDSEASEKYLESIGVRRVYEPAITFTIAKTQEK